MEQNPPTRFSLIEKIKDPRDAEAWSEFAEIYYPLVFGICRRKGLQHADATDIAQEVLSRVANAVGGYRHDQPGATFRGWLYRITRNLTVDFFRRKGRDPLAKAAPQQDLHEIQEPSLQESQEFHFAFRKHLFMVVAKVVQHQVHPQTWAAFWKTEIEHMDVVEASKELSMTRGAIYVARSRVIAKLRKEIQKRMTETGNFGSATGSAENQQ
jgi:RNA polymerase sigma-70 factor (ECF subfamily)